MNINPNAIRVLCFGDSNTWGYIPGTKHERYLADVRWTGILQARLGKEYEIIEEGLNSRGIVNGDGRPGKEQRSATEYVFACLDSHDPLDHVVICLGTNELKAGLGLSAEQVGENFRTLVQAIQSRPSQFRATVPHVTIVVPAAIDESTEYARKDDKFVGAREKSIQLRGVLANIANECGCSLVDIQDQLQTGEDGIHLLAGSHGALGAAVAESLLGNR